jgi:hypothetical protein
MPRHEAFRDRHRLRVADLRRQHAAPLRVLELAAFGRQLPLGLREGIAQLQQSRATVHRRAVQFVPQVAPVGRRGRRVEGSARQPAAARTPVTLLDVL